MPAVLTRRDDGSALTETSLPANEPPSATEISDFFDSVSNSDVREMKRLLEIRPDLVNLRQGEFQMTPLHIAVRSTRDKATKFLLRHGADPNLRNTFGETPLHIAILGKKIERANLLLQNGARDEFLFPNHDADSDLKRVVDICELDKFVIHKLLWTREAFLQAPDDIDAKSKYGYTNLQSVAAWNSDGYLAVDFLIQNGANVNTANDHLDTPLHGAAGNKSSAIAASLIRAGAHLDARNKRGESPLDRAARHANDAVAGYLIEAGANTDIKDEEGKAPLHTAATWGSTKIVDLLIEAGTDIHSKDDCGRKAIHFAAWNGHLDIVKKLLEIDPTLIDALDKWGHRPLRYAEDADKGLVSDYLRKAIP